MQWTFLMLIHMVSFHFRPEAKVHLSEAKAQLQAIGRSIPEVLSLYVGEDVVHSGRSYDLGLVVTLKDEQALMVYNDHELHRPVKAFLAPLYDNAVAVDFIVS